MQAEQYAQLVEKKVLTPLSTFRVKDLTLNLVEASAGYAITEFQTSQNLCEGDMCKYGEL